MIQPSEVGTQIAEIWDLVKGQREPVHFYSSLFCQKKKKKKKELWPHFAYLRCQRVPVSLILHKRFLFSFIPISLFCIMSTIPIKSLKSPIPLEKRT